MNVALAERMLLDAGKSSELANVFRVIADAECDGVLKFSPALCREVARTIVCRTYAPPLLELCHLMRAADACDGGYSAFFWGSGPARPAVFRSYAERSHVTVPDVIRTRSGLELKYSDGAFTVTYSRMPFLSAMMEFIVSSVGFQALDDAAQTLSGFDVTAKQVSDTAKTLAAQIYGYLKENLSSAQNQRKFRHLLNYLDEAGDASPEAVDDDLVLAFWLSESARTDASDFKTFRAVFTGFLSFIQALTVARDHAALQNAGTLGSDRAAGEVDPGDFEFGVEEAIETENPLDSLAAPPSDEIRFLTKPEARPLENLVNAGALAERLPLSILRNENFGAAQAKITQGLRRHLDAAEMTSLIDDSVATDYSGNRERYHSLAGHLEQLCLAAFHVLAEAGRAEALLILLELRPNLDFSALAEHFASTERQGDNVESIANYGVTARFLTIIESTEQLPEPLRTFIAESKAAFAGLSRKGFRDADSREAVVIDGFAGSCAPLFALRKCLDGFRQCLDRKDGGEVNWQVTFEKDKTVFLRQFHLLYGENT